MELRWILILAGIGIFVFLYFSGRPKKRRSIGQAGVGTGMGAGSPGDPYSGSIGQGQGPGSSPPHPSTDPYAPPPAGDSAETYGAQAPYDPQAGSSGSAPASPYANHPAVQHDHRVSGAQPAPGPAAYANHANPTNHGIEHPVDADPLMEAPGMAEPANSYHQAGVGAADYVHQPDSAPMLGTSASATPPAAPFDLDPNDMQRPADAQWNGSPQVPAAPSFSAAQNPLDAIESMDGNGMLPPQNQQAAATRGGGLSGFLSQLSGGLIGKSRNGAATKGHDGQSLYASHGVDPFLITLHIVAPEGQIIHGPRLQALFEQRGYHFGEMSIFHSLNQGSIVFSIAKLVEPGIFDVNDSSSFETPGITMILQLPAPIAADVAFEVLISEASELANALGCSILDGDHSTLSRQTIQHLRDSVHQFMHRQRLAETVPS